MTKFVINPNVKKSKIHKEIYGHFSEHWEDVSMRECM